MTEFNHYIVTLPNGEKHKVGAPDEETARSFFESNYLKHCPNKGECKVEVDNEYI